MRRRTKIAWGAREASRRWSWRGRYRVRETLQHYESTWAGLVLVGDDTSSSTG